MTPLQKRIVHSDLCIASHWMGEAIESATTHKHPDDTRDWVTEFRRVRAELDTLRASFLECARQSSEDGLERFWSQQVKAEFAAEKARQAKEKEKQP